MTPCTSWREERNRIELAAAPPAHTHKAVFVFLGLDGSLHQTGRESPIRLESRQSPARARVERDVPGRVEVDDLACARLCVAGASSGSGIPHVEAVLNEELPQAAFRIIPVKFVGGVLAIGSGLALGREGPTVQMAATIGHLVGKEFRRGWSDCRVLLAAGAGAGLAIAFNAPIAGCCLEPLIPSVNSTRSAPMLVLARPIGIVLRAALPARLSGFEHPA